MQKNDSEFFNTNYLITRFSNLVRRSGFTLAEILITLTIIGVVAALTIPVLSKQIQDIELKNSLKKMYSDFSQATQRIMAENGGSMVGYTASTNSDYARNVFANYLSYVKKCDYTDVYGKCWHQAGEMTYLNGQTDASIEGTNFWNINHTSGLVLNNGAFVLFTQNDLECDYGARTPCGEIIIDVNGAKKPNSIGRDIFAFIVAENALKPYGYWDDAYYTNAYCKKNSTPFITNYSCTAKYIYNY